MKMNSKPNLKATVIFCLSLSLLNSRHTDGMYLYYDYLVDGFTAGIVCENNGGFLPDFNSNSELSEPHWVDNKNCNTSECAVEFNGNCSAESCSKMHKLFCQINWSCVSSSESRHNVSVLKLNGSNSVLPELVDKMSCEEACCAMEDCIGIGYKNQKCLLYEEETGNTQEEEIFKKETKIIKMSLKQMVASEPITFCQTYFSKLHPVKTDTFIKGSIQPTSTFKHIGTTFWSSTFESFFSTSSIRKEEESQSFIRPTTSADLKDSLNSVVSSSFEPSTTSMIAPLGYSSAPSSPKSTVDFSSTLSPSFSSSDCYCQCQAPSTSLTPEESKSKLNKLKEELTIPKKDLSSTIRKKTTAPDYRVSATSIGLVGVGIMCVVFGTIIVMDLGVMLSHLRIFYKNVFGRCQQ